MTEGKVIIEKETGIYRVTRVLTWIAFHTILPVRYHGAEAVREAEGPMVLISNHLHALDPFLLAFPIRDQCFFLAKKELAKNKFVLRLLTSLHCIFVDRHHTDMEAMRSCMKVLKQKKTLIIFPEGTRYHEGQMEQIENGTSLIVLRGKAPLIPFYLDRPLKPFRRVNVWVGDPIPYDDLLEKGVNMETCEALNERMRETYRKMVREYDEEKKHS